MRESWHWCPYCRKKVEGEPRFRSFRTIMRWFKNEFRPLCFFEPGTNDIEGELTSCAKTRMRFIYPAEGFTGGKKRRIIVIDEGDCE